MKVYLYHFECGSEDLYFTGDNTLRVTDGITYNIAAIESKELSYDLKELMGEVSISMPFDQSGYLKDFTRYPFDFPVNASMYSYETSSDTSSLIFRGFVNSFKCSKGMVELGCLSFIEQCRDNYPKISLAKHCCHRVYDDGCTLISGDWTEMTTLKGISTDRKTLTVDLVSDDGYYSYGYMFSNYRYRHISSSTPGVDGTELYLIHPCPTAWNVDDTVYLVAGCDRAQATCQTKFNNYANFLGFPYAPFESIRITGLRASEIKRSKK